LIRAPARRSARLDGPTFPPCESPVRLNKLMASCWVFSTGRNTATKSYTPVRLRVQRPGAMRSLVCGWPKAGPLHQSGKCNRQATLRTGTSRASAVAKRDNDPAHARQAELLMPIGALN
jgi:hypothetical protein